MSAEITRHGIELSQKTTITWAEMAEAFAQADSDGQSEFLEHLAICLSGISYEGGRWPMQCRYIAESTTWMPLNRLRIASQLETLAEHMRESAPLDN